MTIVDILILTAAALAIIAVVGAIGLMQSRALASRNLPTPLWFETEATRPGVR